MKALLLTNKPFLPAIDGGTVASKSFVEQLINEDFDITNLTFSSEKHPFHQDLFAKEKWANFKIQQVRILLKPRLLNALKALLANKSYQLSRFESNQMLELVKISTQKSSLEFIILDSLYSAQMIEKLKKISPNSKFILRTHNIESKIAFEKAQNEKKGLKRFYFQKLAKQLESREKEILKQCDLVLSISEDDTKTLKGWTKSKVITLPFFAMKSDKIWRDSPNQFMHFGAMNWLPNVESYMKLIEEIFPAIQKQCPEVELNVAGSFMESLSILDNKAVHLKGFVENQFEFLSSNGILLAPIMTGSGIRIKIIEALSIGVPVITTIAGAQGIPVMENNGLIVCKSDQEFIEKSIELAQNQQKRLELSHAAKTFYDNWRKQSSIKSILTSYDN